MKDDDIAGRFARIVAASLRIDPADVKPDRTLSDLGAESLDLLEITMETESEFTILLPEKNILGMAREVFGAEALERDGVLTDTGRRFLEARMPELAHLYVPGAVSVAQIEPFFLRVDVWLRMIADLVAAQQRECLECRVPLVPMPPLLMKCPSCNTQVEIRSGDELNREWVRSYYAREVLPST